MRNISIKRNAIINGLRTVLNLLFPIVTFPYISRTLSVDEIGKYNFSSSVVSYFMLIAALGIDKYAVREGAKYRDDKKKISLFASKVYSVNIISTILAYLFLILTVFFSTKLHDYLLCILIFSLQIFFTTIGTEWLYSIYEEYSYITIRSIIFKILSFVALFIFVRSRGDYLNYVWICVIASVGSNILNFIHAKKICSIKFIIKFDWKEVLTPILIIFISNIAIQIYVNSDITMLGYLRDDYAVGIYSVSVRIYTIIKNLLAAVLVVTIPRLASYAGRKMQKEFDDLILKVANVLFLLIIPSMVGLVMLSRNIILIISGFKYAQSAISLKILSWALIFSLFSTLFNQCVLLPYKREKKSLESSVISAFINIGLNFILIPMFSEIGAAVTTLIAEICIAILNYNFSKDITNKIFIDKLTKKNVITIIAGSFAVFISCCVVKKLIFNNIMQLLISIIVSITLYSAILLLFKNPYILEITSLLKKNKFS